MNFFRFQHVIEAVYFSPWLITETGWMAVDKIVSARLLEERAERAKEDFFGETLAAMEIHGDTAVIPVQGIIGTGVSALEKTCGVVDTDDVSADLAAAMANPAVKRVLLNMDTPGGTVGGTAALGEEIASAAKTKRVDSFTGAGRMNCSAGQWITAGCRGNYAAPGATVGSIGVFMPVVDKSEAFKSMGVNVSLIKSGKYKGMGYPGTSLTEEQRALLQDQVNETHAEFKAFVKKHRSQVPDSAMEGQSFSGKKGADVGLITGLRASLADTLAR